MADARARYFRRLRRLRHSAQRWSVLAGGLTAASAVLLPYHGIGLPDVIWAAGAGGSVVVAWWRLAEAHAFAAQPPPPPADPVDSAERARQIVAGVLAGLPGGGAVLAEVRRGRARLQLRGLSVAPGWARLDRAAQTLTGLAGRLGPVAQPALLEATAAEQSLRDVAARTADVERALRLAPDDSREHLTEAHAAMLAQFTEGVGAYERLVAAAASYVAEDGRASVEPSSVSRLSEAADLLHGIAGGLSELRNPPRRPAAP